MSHQSTIVILPDGMKVKPLYAKCPRCGCDLHEFYQSEQDKSNSDEIENDSREGRIPACVNVLQSGHTKLCWLRRFVHWMVHPLRNSPYNASKPDYESFSGGVSRKQTSAIEQNDNRAYDDENFVPRIKGQFRQRIFHFLYRLFVRG